MSERVALKRLIEKNRKEIAVMEDEIQEFEARLAELESQGHVEQEAAS